MKVVKETATAATETSLGLQEQIDGVVAELTRLLGETPRDLILIGVLQARETGLRAQLAAESQRGELLVVSSYIKTFVCWDSCSPLS